MTFVSRLSLTRTNEDEVNASSRGKSTRKNHVIFYLYIGIFPSETPIGVILIIKRTCKNI